MLCGRCASPVPDGSTFCLNCGADLPDPSSKPSANLDDAGVVKLTRMLREETAGEYEIEREIARGGMGVVYLATEIQLRRRVAIKVLPPTLTFGALAIERFRREARTAAALDHPNIIPVYRVSSGGELLWYSMKLLEGRSLDSLLKERGGLDLAETVAILDQVAEALDYAHQRGVVHRDIKPGNIVLDERARVTVTDFGIAKEIQEASLSGSGHLLGSPYYMAPEQYVGGEVHGAADQYALGIVAFQCLSGRVPFEGSSAYELLNKHVSEPPPALAALRPDLPPHAAVAIERALAKQADERFASAMAFVNALAGRAESAALPTPAGRRRAALLWWRVGGGTAAALLLAGFALWRVNRNGRASSLAPIPAAPAAATAVTPPPSTPPVPPPRPVQAPMAVLIIRLSDGWARIYVNGELRGERPVHREELPPGTHTLRFERPGYASIDTTVTLRAGSNLLEIALEREP
jgi:predicted Ser/Thr protein kinase